MRRIHLARLGAIVACLAWLQAAALAQQVTVQTPFRGVSESFSEQMGVQWGLNFPGGFARFGGPGGGMPPFGRFDPNAGLNFGLGFRGGDLSGFFNGSFGQGFQRSFVTQTPMITLTNGVPGYVGDASISPFVVGYIPVVGGSPMFPGAMPPASPSGVGSDAVRQALQSVRSGQARSPVGQVANPPRQDPAPAPAKTPEDSAVERLAAARASSAGQPAPSVAEARRIYATETAAAEQEAQLYWQKAQSAEKAGQLASARVYYRMAAKHASGDLQRQILARLEALKSPPSPGQQQPAP